MCFWVHSGNDTQVRSGTVEWIGWRVKQGGGKRRGKRFNTLQTTTTTTNHNYQPLPTTTTTNHYQPLPTTTNHYQPLPTTTTTHYHHTTYYSLPHKLSLLLLLSQHPTQSTRAWTRKSNNALMSCFLAKLTARAFWNLWPDNLTLRESPRK